MSASDVQQFKYGDKRMNIPGFLTRYYQKGEYPFLSLNDLPFDDANRIKRVHCKKNNIGFFYAQDDYLIHKKEIEKWIYQEFVRMGGKPMNEVPVYMTLGESPKGEFDIRVDVQEDAEEIRIPISDIDISAVSFTYPDSMYELPISSDGVVGDGRRTNTPKVYLYDDLPAVVQKYRVYENYRFYIEAQVWNRDMLHRYWMSERKRS